MFWPRDRMCHSWGLNSVHIPEYPLNKIWKYSTLYFSIDCLLKEGDYIIVTQYFFNLAIFCLGRHFKK